METKVKALAFVVQNKKVLLCKRKDDQFWGGMTGDFSFKNCEELLEKAPNYYKDVFGFEPKAMNRCGIVCKEKVISGQPVKIIFHILLIKGFVGMPNKENYDFDWIDNTSLLKKPMENGDYYWLPSVLRGVDLRAEMKYSEENALLTFESFPKIVDFSLKGRDKI